jgi:hypothetical protein
MLLALLIVTAGCSGRGEPAIDARYDPEKAQAALVAALDAWKKGEARALPRRDPPIRFVDEDCMAGLRLSDYGIEEPDPPTGPHDNVHVILSLRDARGKVVQRDARYQIAIEPALAVLRSDQ